MPSIVGTKDPAIIIGEKITALIRALPEVEDAKVHFARGYEIGTDELPCVSVEVGSDTPTDPDGIQHSAYTNSLQVMYVDIYDHANDAEAMKRITRQRTLAHFAIMNDYTLGLSPMVIQTRYAGAEEPVSDPETGLPGWLLRVVFVVHYKFDDDDRTVIS